MSNQTRQQKYRRHMQEQGCKQYAFWLDDYAQTALKLLKADHPDSDLSTVVNEAIRHYHAYKLTKPVTSDTGTVASDKQSVISNTKGVTSDNKAVTRYMSQELENHILELRLSGLSLNKVAQQLFNEGYKNAKGEPYSTGTLTKAEARAKARQSL